MLSLSVIISVIISGCSNENISKSGVVSSRLSPANEVSCYAEEWKGQVITEEIAEQNDYLLIGHNNEVNDQKWLDFCSGINKGICREITVCNEHSITTVSGKLNSSNELYIQLTTRQYDTVTIAQKTHNISPAVIYTMKNGEQLEYYVSDYLLYTMPLNEKNTVESIPFESTEFIASQKANITFPYNAMFTGISDVESYYDKYNDELHLDVMKEALKEFDKNGGFNAHVIFLHGDLSGSSNISYNYLGCLQRKDEMTIYVTRCQAAEPDGKTLKTQLLVTIDNQYLNDVSPNKINWVVFSDETK